MLRARQSGKLADRQDDKPLDISERARLKALEEEVRRLRIARGFLKKQRRGLRGRANKVRLHC